MFPLIRSCHFPLSIAFLYHVLHILYFYYNLQSLPWPTPAHWHSLFPACTFCVPVTSTLSMRISRCTWPWCVCYRLGFWAWMCTLFVVIAFSPQLTGTTWPVANFSVVSILCSARALISYARGSMAWLFDWCMEDLGLSSSWTWMVWLIWWALWNWSYWIDLLEPRACYCSLWYASSGSKLIIFHLFKS